MPLPTTDRLFTNVYLSTPATRPPLPAALRHLSRSQLRRLPYEAPCPICGEPTIHGRCAKTLRPTLRVVRGREDVSEHTWAPTPKGAAWRAAYAAAHPAKSAASLAWAEAAVARVLARKRGALPPDDRPPAA